MHIRRSPLTSGDPVVSMGMMRISMLFLHRPLLPTQFALPGVEYGTIAAYLRMSFFQTKQTIYVRTSTCVKCDWTTCFGKNTTRSGLVRMRLCLGAQRRAGAGGRAAQRTASHLEGQTHDVAPEVLAPVLAVFFTG